MTVSAARPLGRHRSGLRGSWVAWVGWCALALAVFTVLLVIQGKDPLRAYRDILWNTLGSRYGLSEVLVKMTPLMITALAVTLPARLGLVNVGGEGQMFVGALAASWVALSFPGLSSALLLTLMAVAGAAAGGLWGGVAGVLRARGWLNEVFSTMLLNYVGILAVNALVFGPWRDPTSANYPQSPEFVPAAWLPTLGATRVHVGLFIGIVGIVLVDGFLRSTVWGLKIRVVGRSPVAASRNGIPVARYMAVALTAGGGLAGLAGMAETSAVLHRLSPGLSSGWGYLGFLISWVAGHRPLALIPVSFLLAILAAGGDILQITQGLPYAAVNVLSALILLVVLAGRASGRSS
jgi:ABC-type uncharacterized transport system permease subunit